jgi:hypothetical protein
MMTEIEKGLLKILTPEQFAEINRILDDRAATRPEPPRGPLLMRVKDAAGLVGVQRATIWRLVKAGRIEPVPLLGSVRVRPADVVAVASGKPGDVRRS